MWSTRGLAIAARTFGQSDARAYGDCVDIKVRIEIHDRGQSNATLLRHAVERISGLDRVGYAAAGVGTDASCCQCAGQRCRGSGGAKDCGVGGHKVLLLLIAVYDRNRQPPRRVPSDALLRHEPN